MKSFLKLPWVKDMLSRLQSKYRSLEEAGFGWDESSVDADENATLIKHSAIDPPELHLPIPQEVREARTEAYCAESVEILRSRLKNPPHKAAAKPKHTETDKLNELPVVVTSKVTWAEDSYADKANDCRSRGRPQKSGRANLKGNRTPSQSKQRRQKVMSTKSNSKTLDLHWSPEDALDVVDTYQNGTMHVVTPSKSKAKTSSKPGYPRKKFKSFSPEVRIPKRPVQKGVSQKQKPVVSVETTPVQVIGSVRWSSSGRVIKSCDRYGS